MPTPIGTTDKKSPTGNPNGRFPFGSEESPTMLQKHLILIISRPICTKFYCYSCIFQFLPHRTPKLLSSHCNGSWPFSLHAPECALFQPPDRRHTVKQRGLPLAWSSLKFYPLTPYKTYRLSLLKPLQNIRLSLQKISRYPPKGRKKMAELHVCKVKRIFITYFWTSKVDMK